MKANQMPNFTTILVGSLVGLCNSSYDKLVHAILLMEITSEDALKANQNIYFFDVCW